MKSDRNKPAVLVKLTTSIISFPALNFAFEFASVASDQRQAFGNAAGHVTE